MQTQTSFDALLIYFVHDLSPIMVITSIEKKESNQLFKFV